MHDAKGEDEVEAGKHARAQYARLQQQLPCIHRGPLVCHLSHRTTEESDDERRPTAFCKRDGGDELRSRENKLLQVLVLRVEEERRGEERRRDERQ